jgi:hypothetical protein
MQVPNCFSYPLIFVNVGEILVMVDDVATPLNPLVAPIEKEELKKTSFDVNVFQLSRKEEVSKRVLRIRVDRLAWDYRLSLNPHALAIYLEFVHIRGITLEKFEERQCEDDDVHLHYRTWVPGDGHCR